MTTTTQTKAGEALGEAFSAYVNSAQSTAQDISFAHVVSNDHRTLQQKTVATMLTAILAFARHADEGWTDARNEQSGVLCQKIRDLIEAENVYVTDDGAVRLAYI